MKSIKRLLSGAILSILLLSSCAPAAVAQEDLAGTQWLLVSLDHEDQIGPRSANEMAVLIVFDSDGTINGSGGCPDYTGLYHADAHKGLIAISGINPRVIDCGDVGQIDSQLYFEALTSAKSYTVMGDVLRIFAGEHTLVFLGGG